MDTETAVERLRLKPFRLGACLVDPQRNRISCDGISVRVEPKVMDVLLTLCARSGEVVSKDELFQSVWQGAFVTEHVLSHAVWQLRKALGNAGLIESIPKRGYRVTVKLDTGAPPEHRGKRPAQTGSRESAIVVLPLANLTGDPAQEYFTDGMTDALISRLAQCHQLRVISRTSAMHYKGLPKPITEIGVELNVDVAIEGSVFRQGNRVRISAQLIDAHEDAHIWAGTFERDLADVFELQRELAEAVTSKVTTALGEPVYGQMSKVVNPEAYEAYLRGNFCYFRFDRESIDAALHYYQIAAKLDPTFAAPFSGITRAWIAKIDMGVVPSSAVVRFVKEAAQNALRLDEGEAESHTAVGIVKFVYDWNWSGAEEDFQRAIQLNPNDPFNRICYSDLLYCTGRFEEGYEHITYGVQLDPHNPACQCFLGWYLIFSRQTQEAIVELQKVTKADPTFRPAHQGLWGAYYQMQNWERALQEARIFFSLHGDAMLIPSETTGNTEREYRQIMLRIAEQLEERTKTSYVPNLRIARMYAHAGETEAVFRWLECAFVAKESPLVHLGVGWDWDNVKCDRRFQSLLRRIGLPPLTEHVQLENH